MSLLVFFEHQFSELQPLHSQVCLLLLNIYLSVCENQTSKHHFEPGGWDRSALQDIFTLQVDPRDCYVLLLKALGVEASTHGKHFSEMSIPVDSNQSGEDRRYIAFHTVDSYTVGSEQS